MGTASGKSHCRQDRIDAGPSNNVVKERSQDQKLRASLVASPCAGAVNVAAFGLCGGLTA